MSESLKVHWILKYFTGIAQTHGGNLLNVPDSAKKQRVQITQFLTFPRDDHPDDAVWARVSDKEFSVPVKFTTKAVSDYNRSKNIYADSTFRLTKRRHALATLGQFKPFFTRVPLSNGRGMDSVERLALEVNLVSVIGADHEGIFGNPRDLETNEDMKAWCEGLREGGGGGNVLKVAKEVERHVLERARSRTEAGPILQNGVVPFPEKPSGEHHARPANESEIAVTEQTTIKREQQHPKAENKPEKERDLLKEWKKSWRVTEFLWPYIVDIPEEVKLEHMQILKFGRDNKGSHETSLRDMSFLEDSIDELERKEEQRSQEAEERAERKGLPIREQSQKNSQSLPSPKSTPAKEEVRETVANPSSNPRATTPSVWAASDDEAEGHVNLHDAEGKNLDGSQIAIVSVEADSSNSNVKASPLSQHSSKPATGEESPIKEPTPAQRRVQNFRKPAFPFHNGTRHTERSQTQTQMHTQSTQSDSSAINESSASFDMSQTRYGVGQLSTSTMLKHQVPHIDLRREALERDRERPPRILVPDSDASGEASQHGHSQSQSQSQSQSRSKIHSQSQAGSSRSQSQPLLPVQPQNIDMTNDTPPAGQMTGYPKKQPSSSKSANNTSETQHPSVLDSATKDLPVGESGEHKLARSQSTSQTQTDSLHSVDDPFFDRQRSKPVVIQQRKSSPLLVLSSQNNARDSRTQEKTLEDVDKGIKSFSEDDVAPIVMDVDDARTHAMLLSSTHRRLDRDEASPGADHSNRSSKAKQFTIKELVGSPHPKGELHYTPTSLNSGYSQQSSPSAHLGKRPRSSSVSFQQSSPRISQDTRKEIGSSFSAPLRKKARRPPPEDKYVVQRVEHKPEAWQTASFMQLPAKKYPLPITQTLSSVKEAPKRAVEASPSSSSQSQTKPQGAGSSTAAGRKSTSADLAFKARSREIHPIASKSRPTSRRQMSTDSDPGVGSRGAAAAETLREPAKKSSSSQLEPARKLSRVEAGTLLPPVPGSSLFYSNGKFIVDFTLRREQGAPQWINWPDIENTLLKIGRLRHKEAEALKNTK